MKRLTAKEIRAELIKHGLTQAQANEIKGVKKLLEKLDKVKLDKMKLDKAKNMKDNELGLEVELEEEETTNNKEPEKQIGYLDPEWSDYALSHFTENELQEGQPTVVGLRRVTELLLGEIIYSSAEEIKYYKDEAICRYVIKMRWNRTDGFVSDVGTDQIRVFSGTASANPTNNPEMEFGKYHVAIAETRAEGRALRKALRLKTICVEEATSAMDVEPINNGLISSTQKNGLKTVCNRLEIDISKLLKKHNYESLDSLTKQQAIDLLRQLNLYQTQREEIPNDIKN